ncbi:MAG: ROK family protein [Terriglobia bacterium]
MAKSDTALQRIYLEIASKGEASLPSLSRAAGLRPPALESKLHTLARRGLVEFSKDRKKAGVNPRYGYVVGIDLGASHLHFALADFRGEILQDSTIKIRPEDGPRKLIAQIQEGIRALATEAGRSHLRAISIGVPSAVDSARGVVGWANNLPGWTNIHLGRELEKAFRVPIYLENDANMAAIGEHWLGVAKGVRNFVFVALGTGIGSGIFINGKLYAGRTGWAGELFRMNVEWQRWNEEFPDTGYFESYVAGLGIAAEGRKALGAPPAGEAGLREERDAYFVFQAHREGNPKATAALEKIFTILGVGMSNVVAVLDPDLIVFGGGIAKGAPDLMLSIVEKVVRRIQGEITPPFAISSLGDKAQTYGAIRSALDVASTRIATRLR